MLRPRTVVNRSALGTGRWPPSVVVAEAEESAAPYTVHTRLRLSATSHRTPHVR
ncbi:hypothetical protein [Streptomyces bungoensis]|uniref:hypothetical protein n=1 Tax=Streptomyces bungoensis TaxID=285568 RepID=UPI000A495AB3|nr:hypothetical protein [Streptomyces bungoensis]